MQKLVSLTKDYLISAEEKSSDLPRLASDLESQFKLVESLHEEYKIKNKSCNLYGMLIVGIAVLLICSSATVFTTGLTFNILGMLAKIASGYLAGIAIFRFHNYLKS